MQNVRYSRPQCIVWCVWGGGGGRNECERKGVGGSECERHKY